MKKQEEHLIMFDSHVLLKSPLLEEPSKVYDYYLDREQRRYLRKHRSTNIKAVQQYVENSRAIIEPSSEQEQHGVSAAEAEEVSQRTKSRLVEPSTTERTTSRTVASEASNDTDKISQELSQQSQQ